MILPQTEWLQPKEFPDLSKYNEIAIDLETRDPELKKRGSGSVVGLGEIVGFAVAVEGWKGYYPIAHETGFPPKVLKYSMPFAKASATSCVQITAPRG